MDCKIYLQGGQIADVANVKSIKAVRSEHNKDKIILAIYGTDDENRTPIASFYDIVGYELIGRR